VLHHPAPVEAPRQLVGPKARACHDAVRSVGSRTSPSRLAVGRFDPKIPSIATHATDDPKATLAWLTAVVAIGADKECAVALVGDAVGMAKEAIAKNIHGVGFPPLTELIDKVVAASIPVFL
jgi:hypothetical protein